MWSSSYTDILTVPFRAKYLIVVGHYPIFDTGSIGVSECLVPRLLPLMYEYDVTAYLSSHEHYLKVSISYRRTEATSHIRQQFVPKSKLKS